MHDIPVLKVTLFYVCAIYIFGSKIPTALPFVCNHQRSVNVADLYRFTSSADILSDNPWKWPNLPTDASAVCRYSRQALPGSLAQQGDVWQCRRNQLGKPPPPPTCIVPVSRSD
jgi:hypothetical protein